MPTFIEKIQRIKNKLLGKGKRKSTTNSLFLNDKRSTTASVQGTTSSSPASRFDVTHQQQPMRPFSAMATLPSLQAISSDSVTAATSKDRALPTRPLSEAYSSSRLSTCSSRFSDDKSEVGDSRRASIPHSLVLDHSTIVDPPLRSSSKRYSQTLSQGGMPSPALSSNSRNSVFSVSSSDSISNLEPAAGVQKERSSSLPRNATQDESGNLKALSPRTLGAPLTSKKHSMLTPMASLMYDMRRNAYIEKSDNEKKIVAGQRQKGAMARPATVASAASSSSSTLTSEQGFTSTFSEELNSEISNIISSDKLKNRFSYPPVGSREIDFRNTIVTKHESTSLDVVVHPRPFFRRKSSAGSIALEKSPQLSGSSPLLSSSLRGIFRRGSRTQSQTPIANAALRQEQSQEQPLLEEFPWLQPNSASGQLDEQPVTWIEVPNGFSRDLVMRMCASAKWRQRANCIKESNGAITILPGCQRICIDGGTLVQRHKLLRIAQRWFRDHEFGGNRPSTTLVNLPSDDANSLFSGQESPRANEPTTPRRHSYDSAMSSQSSLTSLTNITPPATPPLTRDEREIMKQANIFVNYDYVHM